MDTDPQSNAFRGADPEQWDEVELVDHPQGTLDDLDPDDGTRRTVEDYEADGWDVDRAEPKSLDEARENLTARINDPEAPDTEDEAGSYDEPDDDRGYR